MKIIRKMSLMLVSTVIILLIVGNTNATISQSFQPVSERPMPSLEGYPLQDNGEWNINPDLTYVELICYDYPHMNTCPMGWLCPDEDTLHNVQIMVYCFGWDGNPISGIPASAFYLRAENYNAEYYDRDSYGDIGYYMFFTPQEAETGYDGGITFDVFADTSMVGEIYFTIRVDDEFLFGTGALKVKSYDWNGQECDGRCGLIDFAWFASNFYSSEWSVDFNGDELVDVVDFVMFAQHFHHVR